MFQFNEVLKRRKDISELKQTNKQPKIFILTVTSNPTLSLKMKQPYFQKHIHLITLNHKTLWNLALPIFKISVWISLDKWIFSWIKLPWYFCFIRGKLWWLTWFWEFFSEGLSSFNKYGFCYSLCYSHGLPVPVREGLPLAQNLPLENS